MPSRRFLLPILFLYIAALSHAQQIACSNWKFFRAPDPWVNFGAAGIDSSRTKRIHEALPEMPIVLFSLFASLVGPEHEFAAIVPKEKAGNMLQPTVHALLSLPSTRRRKQA